MAFINELINAFGQIGSAFVSDLGVWWFLAPIFVLWFAMEFYFGEYQKEKWGFSSSLANSVSFTWVNITSLRIISLEGGILDDRLLIAVAFLFYGIILIYASFKHSVSERIMRAIAGPTPVYFLSIVSVLWGQGLLAISFPVVADLILLYGVIWGVWTFIKKRYLGVLGEVEAIKKGERPL